MRNRLFLAYFNTSGSLSSICENHDFYESKLSVLYKENPGFLRNFTIFAQSIAITDFTGFYVNSV